MRRRYFLAVCVFAIDIAMAGTVMRANEVGAASFVGAAATALARADVALARSCIVANHIKGDFGESVAGNAILKSFLEKEGRWSAITPRSGRKGLDHLFIKTYKSGKISQILVGESKYGTSTLNNTADGFQGSRTYVNKRLAVLAKRYEQLSQTQSFRFGKAPVDPNRELCVKLPSGKKVYFWREKAGGEWYFTGTREELAQARELLPNYAAAFNDAANGVGRIAKFRSRVFHIVPKGNDVEINIYDGTKIPNGNMKAAVPINKKPIVINGALLDKNVTSDRELAAVLKRKLHYDDAEALATAKYLREHNNPKSLMAKFSLVRKLAVNSAIAAGVAAATDFAAQLLSRDGIDVAPLALSAGSVFVGTLAGQGAHIALINRKPRAFIKRISGPLRCSAAATTTVISSVAGGAVVSALMSYGSYFLGWSNLKDANRNMVIGTTASVAGAGTAAGVLTLVGAYGTASTGTAISALSGAAATNASLAWLGGGSVAAGGGGVAAGTAVLTGGVIIVVIGVAAAGTYAYSLYDQHAETKRISLKLKAFRDEAFLAEVLNKAREKELK